MAYRRDEVYGLSPMDRMALETTRPVMKSESQRYRISSNVDPDLMNDVELAPPERRRNPHCWLFTALFLFVVILGGILIIHFRDDITKRGGTAVQIDDDAQNSNNQTFYMNVESGIMKNKRISGTEAKLLNMLAGGNMTAIENYLKNLGVKPLTAGTVKMSSLQKFASQNLALRASSNSGDSGKADDTPTDDNAEQVKELIDYLLKMLGDDPNNVNPLDLFLQLIPYLVLILGGPASPAAVAMVWLINTQEMKPLLIKYLGQAFFDTLLANLQGANAPDFNQSTNAPAKLEKSDGFQQIGMPDLIMPVHNSLISPETAAEIQGLLFS